MLRPGKGLDPLSIASWRYALFAVEPAKEDRGRRKAQQTENDRTTTAAGVLEVFVPPMSSLVVASVRWIEVMGK